MKLTNLVGAVLITALLAGSTLYVANFQSEQNLAGISECDDIKAYQDIPTLDNPNPRAVVVLRNKCYNQGYKFQINYEEYNGTKKQLITGCIKNDDQLILQNIHMVQQIKYVYYDSKC